MRFASRAAECRNLHTESPCTSAWPTEGSAQQGLSWWDSARDFHGSGLSSLIFVCWSCLLEKEDVLSFLLHLSLSLG